MNFFINKIKKDIYIIGIYLMVIMYGVVICYIIGSLIGLILYKGYIDGYFNKYDGEII